MTLDRFAASHRLPNVLKVDVEGAEEEVLKGAEQVFRTANPILICEVHSARTAEGVARWLGARGYRWSWLKGARNSHGIYWHRWMVSDHVGMVSPAGQ